MTKKTKQKTKKTIEDLIPKSAFNHLIMMKLKIKEIEKSVDREKLVYRTSEYTSNFRNFLLIITFGRDIYEGKVTLEEASKD